MTVLDQAFQAHQPPLELVPLLHQSVLRLRELQHELPHPGPLFGELRPGGVALFNEPGVGVRLRVTGPAHRLLLLLCGPSGCQLGLLSGPRLSGTLVVASGLLQTGQTPFKLSALLQQAPVLLGQVPQLLRQALHLAPQACKGGPLQARRLKGLLPGAPEPVPQLPRLRLEAVPSRHCGPRRLGGRFQLPAADLQVCAQGAASLLAPAGLSPRLV